MISRNLRKKVENSNSGETIRVAIDLGPDYVSAGDDEVNKILNDYGIDGYNNLYRPEWWTVRIECQTTVESLQKIKKEGEENRIKHIFILNNT